MPENRVTGSCLCGEVSYAIKGNMGIFQYCNCSRCRKFSGSAFASNLFVAPDDDPQIKPMQNVYCASRAVWYQAPEGLPSHDELPSKK
jgi:hypothetical protein